MRGYVLAVLLSFTPVGVYAHSQSNEHPDLPSLSAEDYALPDKLNLPRNATNAWIKQNGDGLRADIDQYHTGRNTNAMEGANKQVISSQADSLIKISRIWADFFPANTSNQPV